MVISLDRREFYDLVLSTTSKRRKYYFVRAINRVNIGWAKKSELIKGLYDRFPLVKN